MPQNKQVIISHFSGLNLPPSMRLGNSIFILWVSPEQQYYQDPKAVNSIVDAANNSLDFSSSIFIVVIAGYLQRFNFYPGRYDTEISFAQADVAARRAIELGNAWYKQHKKSLSCLNCPRERRLKQHWHESLGAAAYSVSKKRIDERYKRDGQFAADFEATGRMHLKSLKAEGVDEAVYLYNSGEYLREEGAWVDSLVDTHRDLISKGMKIYLLYPHDATPAIKDVLRGVEERCPSSIFWLPIELKQRNTDKFDLPQYLFCNPHCGCSRRTEQMIEERERCKHQRGASQLPIAMATPQSISTLFVLASEQKTRLDLTWGEVIRTSVPRISCTGAASPGSLSSPGIIDTWSAFFAQAKVLGELPESPISTSPPSAPSSPQRSAHVSDEEEDVAPQVDKTGLSALLPQ